LPVECPIAYQLIIVMDLTGFGVWTVRGGFYECFNTIGNVDKDYYYENVYRVYIINAPTFFKFFWRTLSPLFDPDTRIKFNLLNKQDDLAEYINPKYIPAQFGGQSPHPNILYSEASSSIYAQHFDAFVSKWRAGEVKDEAEYVASCLAALQQTVSPTV